MSESFKPWIQSPDVRESQDELKEALSAEEMAFKYKAETEEMLAFTDRVKQYVSYDDVLASEFFGKLPEHDHLRMTLSKHAEDAEDAEDGRKTILYDDLTAIMDRDEGAFEDLVFQGVKNDEARKVKEIEKEADIPAKRLDEVEGTAIGKTADLMYSYDRFLELREDVANASEEDFAKIKTFEKVNRAEARIVIKEIKTIKDALEQAKRSKNIAVVQKVGEVGAVYKTGEERARRRQQRLEKLFERQTGRKVELGIEERYDQFGNIVAKDFLPAYVNYHGEMARLHDLLKEGKIVETKYIEGLINEAMDYLKKNPPTVVYFHGDFGSGKTALAVHIARTKFLDADGKRQEPIIISGSKFLEPDRLSEEFRLGKLSEKELLNKMAKDLDVSAEFNDDTSFDEILSSLVGSKDVLRAKMIENVKASRNAHGQSSELSDAVKEDIEQQVDDAFGNSVQGRYVLGAMYMAMKEGRPLIVDEANAISPDVLIAFNDLLTKKIGDPVQTRGVEGEFTIKKGYCVMWTGNTGKRYENQAGRKDLDPAAYSRIAPIKVEYLPQSREVNSMNAEEVLGRLDLDKLQEKTFADNETALAHVKNIRGLAQNDQIFQVLLLKLLNDREGAELVTKKDDRYSVFKDLYRLSMGARLIMDLFEEKNDEKIEKLGLGNLKNLIKANTFKEVTVKLRKANLSMRELIDNIVGSYADQNGSMDIEYYLYKFIRKYDQYPEEQAILITMLRKCNFFEPDAGWPDYENAHNLKEMSEELAKNPVELEKLAKYKRVQVNGDYVSMVNTEGKYSKEYFTSLETMQLLFGYMPPMKKETYEQVQGIVTEKRKDAERKEANYSTLLNRVREIAASLTAEVFDRSSEHAELMRSLRPVAMKILDKEFQANATDEQFIETVSNFCDIIIDFLSTKGKISAEEGAKAKRMDVGDKTSFLVEALHNIGKKKK